MFDSHFSVNNIPFGIASSAIHPNRSVATRIGDKVVFLDELAKHGLLLGLTIAAIESFSQVIRQLHSFNYLVSNSVDSQL
jgi:fumarylacetoacetase